MQNSMMSSSFGQYTQASGAKHHPPAPILVAYGAFAVAAGALYYLVVESDNPFAAVITLAEMLQCLAMLLLAAQVLSTGSVHNISGKAVFVEALALVCRLSSTCFFNGYLPVGESGDWFYQCVDICALAVACWLLFQVFCAKQATYKDTEDSMPIGALIVACFVLAALFHGTMNLRPFFDSMWMAGLFLGTVAVLPQLWLIMRSGGHVTTLMCHHIAAMAAGRILAGYFMWLAREEIHCNPWIPGVNHATIAILGAHLLHVVLIADFAYVYIKALMVQGLGCEVVLEDCGMFV